VAPETQIRVIVSQGPERRVVPRVEGFLASQAERMLAASGFRVAVRRVRALRAPGSVVGTEPEAGTSVQMPAAVSLLVSAGPPNVAAPMVMGLLEPDARAALEGAGLRAGEVELHVRPDLPEGLVVAQVPAPGDSLAAGSGVRLFVATQQEPLPEAPEPQGEPDASGTPDTDQGGEI
jgi:serine/threonine-protein kinase